MVKKLPLKRQPKRAAKKISLQKIKVTSPKNIQKKINLKNNKYSSKKVPLNLKSNQKEESNLDLVSQSFFDAQSSIKVQCCFCEKNITNSIKILLEPFPKNIIIPQKKGSLPFELICLKCLVIKLENNSHEIESIN